MPASLILRRDRFTGLNIVQILAAAISVIVAPAATADPCPPSDCAIEVVDAVDDVFVECNGNSTVVNLIVTSDCPTATFEWNAPDATPHVTIENANSATPTVTLHVTDLIDENAGIEGFNSCLVDFYIPVNVISEGQIVSSCAVTILVQNTTPPSITSPNDLPVECTGPGSDYDDQYTAWIDSAAADQSCGLVTITHEELPTITANCVTSRPVRFTATDACEHSSIVVRYFNIADQTGPVITSPEPNKNITYISPAQLQTDLTAWLNSFTAVDTCTNSAATVTHSPVNLDSACSDVAGATVTFYATDACGNTSQAPGTFSVTPAVITVNENVVVNFNTVPPTYSGDPDLLPFFTYDISGPTADTWNAVFNVGYSKLKIVNGATITVSDVPVAGNNRRSPGIIIRSNRDLQMDQGTAIIVDSMNMAAGNILIKVFGDVTIFGSITNTVYGTNGTPGAIEIVAGCGDIITGPMSRIETSGVDHGGSDISLVACGPGTALGGDILICGMVHAFHKYGPTPTIDVVSLDGRVTIDGTNDFGNEVVGGTTIRRTSGLLVETLMATSAGDINIQAMNDIKVIGNVIQNRNRTQYGAVAVKPHSTNGQGGDGDIKAVSLLGKIIASNRAFDFENRFNALNAITLQAAGNIELTASGVNDVASGQNASIMLVVNSDGGSGAPSQGGTNTLRSYSGTIAISTNARVSANHGPVGLNGSNVLYFCPSSIANPGNVVPGAPATSLNGMNCSPSSPTALFLFSDCPTCQGF